jgi:hypothetical protein
LIFLKIRCLCDFAIACGRNILQHSFDGHAGEMNRSDLRQLAEIRLKEAELLLASGAYEGAYYLAWLKKYW